MRLAVLASLVFLTACGQSTSHTKRLAVEGSGQKVVIVAGVVDAAALKAQAEQNGVTVTGDVILRLEGDAESLANLEVNSDALVALDTPLMRSQEAAFTPVEGSQYLAKKDFGILEFWKTNPSADGRGVTVGVFDDGISPNQVGFQLTTTGERKFLKRGSNSTLSTFTLTQNGDVWEGDINEDQPPFDGYIDLNGNGKKDAFKAKVSDKVCLDLNGDGSFGDDECKGTFSATGEYFTLPGTVFTTMVEFDAGKLKFSQPELAGDSHGEGVASVMAAHNQGNIEGMDGVAPGAKIVDYDLSEKVAIASEGDYTMGNILLGLEWLAKNGAEVANISYSLFFSSVESQDFMAKAIDALVKKYNIVLSFSAGNNGPGLGSLNRKVIYPDSVLVAGAFVSKELDERVWGVTGLPDEGRVIYYSSRGPGPLGDQGPTLISPLSSLTQSSASEGFRAFNGTSSASPALAGAATVLISAVKQAGLKVDAPTIVQALRLSGKRLKGEPFVAQGYGLPQIPAALAIYRELIAGSRFMNVTIRANKNAQDGVGGRGLLFLTSQSGEVESATVNLTGVLSALAPLSARTNLVTPIKLEYSAGLKGASELWVAVSGSRVNVEVNQAEVLAESAGEGFGEIKLKDARTGELMAIVPVTVLDDRSALQRRRVRLTVGSQGSARIHLNAPAGLSSVRIKAKLLEGSADGLSISTFDSHRVRTQQVGFTDEVWLPISRPGHHQVALSMNGGTGREAVVEFELEPMNMELRTRTAKAAKPNIELRYGGASSLYTKVELIPVSETLATAISDVGTEVKALEASVKLTEKVSVGVDLAPLEEADTAYFYSNCSGKVVDAEGKETLIGSSYSSPDEKERTVTFRCMPFDHGIGSGHKSGWSLRVFKSTSATSNITLAFPPRGSKEFDFTEQKPGKYEVWMKNIIGGQSLKLGVVDLL